MKIDMEESLLTADEHSGVLYNMDQTTTIQAEVPQDTTPVVSTCATHIRMARGASSRSRVTSRSTISIERPDKTYLSPMAANLSQQQMIRREVGTFFSVVASTVSSHCEAVGTSEPKNKHGKASPLPAITKVEGARKKRTQYCGRIFLHSEKTNAPKGELKLLV